MNWIEPNTPCVILCAGRGTRLNLHLPKVLHRVNGKPLFQHVVDFWKPYVRHFIFVVGYRRGCVIPELPSGDVVIQEEEMGIAHAIAQVETLINNRFIVALGDCLQRGEFDIPDDMEQGQMVWDTLPMRAIHRGNLLVTKDGLITQSIEKAQTYPGMGTYFFDRRVFDWISSTPASSLRGEIEISDAVDQMARSSRVSAVLFGGDFLNVTYPEDIVEAERLFPC